MGEVLGLVVVLGIIGLLIYELIRKIIDLKFAPKEKSTVNNRVMIISLFSVILFFSLNILVYLNIIANDYVTRISTSNAILISFGVYVIVKLRINKEKQKSSNMGSLLK